MSRRPLIKTLIAGVVTSVVAVALLPAIAQATEPPKGYDNFHEVTTHIPIIANGKITLNSSTLGEIHCLNTFYAYGWNEHEHGESSKPIRGYGEVVGWGTSSCEAPTEETTLGNLYHKKVTTAVSAEMPTEENCAKRSCARKKRRYSCRNARTAQNGKPRTSSTTSGAASPACRGSSN